VRVLSRQETNREYLLRLTHAYAANIDHSRQSEIPKLLVSVQARASAYCSRILRAAANENACSDSEKAVCKPRIVLLTQSSG
jgi:hypothetical protein